MKKIYLTIFTASFCFLSTVNQVYGQGSDSSTIQQSENRSVEKGRLGDDNKSISDGSSKQKFENGEIKFDCFWACAYKFNRPQLAHLYNEKQWESLATFVIDVGLESDLSYYYLGYSAEMLGHFKAAETYYRLGVKTKEKCKGGSFNLCNGIDLPGEFNVRIQASSAKDYAKRNNLSPGMTESSIAAHKRSNRISRSKAVSADGTMSIGEKDPNGELIKLRCNISGAFLISSANWDVFIDTINGKTKMIWIGGTDPISEFNTKVFEQEIDLMIDDNNPPSYKGIIQTGPRTAISYLITRPEFNIIIADTALNKKSPWGQCTRQ